MLVAIKIVTNIDAAHFTFHWARNYFKIITSLPSQMSNQLALDQTIIGGIDQPNDQLLRNQDQDQPTHQNHLMHPSEPQLKLR